ncbi:hypothetical protein QQS21_009728 [Conoideocrella luteorostrata]|uniref:Zn(2)-C6 fungal-type domain-containing protein n=1 Tax=Conoideocrella luteorostrata TaxID=1105319 RepID=A0AAJ0CGE3_9HYPO|nr:hypothetical protein QQS21_009728 [Conoideocrella luteorostrata]
MQTPEAVSQCKLPDSNGTARGRQRPACEECRRRKLRCDGQQPQCSVCKETGVACEVNPVRAPRGPKRGYLKNLRNRVSMLESKLAAHAQDLPPEVTEIDSGDILSSPPDPVSDALQVRNQDTVQDFFSMMNSCICEPEMGLASPLLDLGSLPNLDTLNLVPEPPSTPSTTTCINSISAPVCELTQAELDQLFFDRVHPSVPILHQRRYHSWSKLQVKSTARVSLQYAMWTLASLLSGQFQHLQDGFYQETKQMLESLSHGNSGPGSSVDVEVAQTWLLIAIYESMRTYHQHAWMSAGRAFKLVQLMKLHEIDKPKAATCNSDIDHVATEEKRRVFWMAYFLDHLFSIGNGLSIRLNEHAICTRLPAPDTDFQSGQNCIMDFLPDAIADRNPTVRSPLNECIILATICGRTLFYNQLYNVRCLNGDNEPDSSDWNAWLDNSLSVRLQILSTCYPSPTSGYDPMLLFAHVIAQASVMYLCKELNSMLWSNAKARSLRTEYHQRALNAAEHLVNLARALVEYHVFKASVSLISMYVKHADVANS